MDALSKLKSPAGKFYADTDVTDSLNTRLTALESGGGGSSGSSIITGPDVKGFFAASDNDENTDVPLPDGTYTKILMPLGNGSLDDYDLGDLIAISYDYDYDPYKSGIYEIITGSQATALAAAGGIGDNFNYYSKICKRVWPVEESPPCIFIDKKDHTLYICAPVGIPEGPFPEIDYRISKFVSIHQGQHPAMCFSSHINNSNNAGNVNDPKTVTIKHNLGTEYPACSVVCRTSSIPAWQVNTIVPPNLYTVTIIDENTITIVMKDKDGNVLQNLLYFSVTITG